MKVAQKFRFWRRLTLFGAFSLLAPLAFAQDAEFKARIEADWERQESSFKRTLETPDAFETLVERADALRTSLVENELLAEDELADFERRIADAKSLELNALTPEEIRAEYLSFRWAVRDVAFQNPLVNAAPVVFMKANRFGYQVLQEYLSYYVRYTNQRGGGLFVLKNPGRSFETDDLTTGRFPRGLFSTPSLSFDGKTLYFAFADFSKVQDPDENAPVLTVQELIDKGYPHHILDYIKEPEGKYHLYKMDLATRETTQLTDGPADDFDPTLLPNGNVVFISTRRGGFARCNQGWEPIQTATLHELLPNGDVKQLSWHETNEWSPSVLPDGRVIYCRWDYVDRNAARYQGLWITNPDGTQASSLFGNYTEEVCVCIQPQPIPNSRKVMFLAAGHHLSVGGSLVILDPSKVEYDPETGCDRLDAIERVTPEIPFPETPCYDREYEPERAYYIPRQYYYSPYPLSEDYYFVSYSGDPLDGYLTSDGQAPSNAAGKLGLYYRDRFGNLELMYEDDKYDCRYPMPVAERDVPETLPTRWDDSGTQTGTFVLTNVAESLWPFPQDRKIKELRVFELLAKFPSHQADVPKVGHDFAGNARAFLGTVPVEEDGSAHFEVPAGKPLYFQAVDEDGRAVQTMLSEVYLQPGENRGCVGCHEQAQTTIQNTELAAALKRPASQLEPGPEGSAPFSYPLLIQPILDRACLECHNADNPVEGAETANDGKVAPVLGGGADAEFSVSYYNLRPYLRWYEWIPDASIRPIVSFPGECGADMSPLSEILEDENHAGKMKLTEADKKTLYLWLDANVPFFGSYVPEDQDRQRAGESIPIPTLPTR